MKDLLTFNEEEIKQLREYLENGHPSSCRQASLNEIKELLGCQVYELNRRSIKKIGKVQEVYGSKRINIDIYSTLDYSNNFTNLRYYKEYNIYADYSYSNYLIFLINDVGSFCKRCINACYNKEVTECDFFEE